MKRTVAPAKEGGSDDRDGAVEAEARDRARVEAVVQRASGCDDGDGVSFGGEEHREGVNEVPREIVRMCGVGGREHEQGPRANVVGPMSGSLPVRSGAEVHLCRL